jgi:hypothetical protein
LLLRGLFLLILLIAVGPQATPALGEPAAPSESWGLHELMLRLGAVQTATAHFVEHKYLHMLKKPLVASGTLVYMAPGHLQKDTLQPRPEHLLIDGDSLLIERDGKTQTLQLADYPQIGAFIEGIRATLAGDLAALDRIYAVRLEGSSEAWQLVLQPRDAKMQEIVHQILISGSEARVERIDTQEADGDRSEMTIIGDAP